ncbi:hypothetical protein, partial [Roseisolibacter sp. H3M3-2]|uniref:hypothetical protein n=1 Tax=Roseisolibacter sp. H3M3-2 TaxID=3031323 RepID=UPI0031BC9146|nr:hypothetical protein [Roseisolibacter sp. H3M3-2]
AALGVVGAALAVVAPRRTAPPPAPALGAPRRVTFEAGLEVDPVVSPDGRLVAYAAGPDDAMRIHVRQLDGGRAIVVSGDLPGPHRRPRWSPDGARLLFQAGRALWVVPTLGGAARQVVAPPADTMRLAGYADWSPDGARIAYGVGDTVYVRDAAGGAPRAVGAAWWPHSLAWSPDGRWIAAVQGNPGFVYGALPWQMGVARLGNLAPSSLWLFAADGGAPPRALTDETALNTSPTWLDARTLAFVSGRDGPRDLYTLALDGDGAPAGAPARLTTALGAHVVAATRGGGTLAFGVLRMRANVWALPIGGDGPSTMRDAVQVTHGDQTVEGPAVSPDGRTLVYDSDRSGRQDLWRLRLDAPGAEPEPLVELPGDDFRPSWSADGRWLAFYTIAGGVRRAAVMPAEGGAPHLVEPGARVESHSPALSPDGRRLAFYRDVGPRWQLYETERTGDSTWRAARALPGGDGNTPQWSPDGARLAFLRGTEVRVLDPGGAARTVVAPRDPRLGGALATYARWLPDGRALVVSANEASGATTFWRVPLDGAAPRLLARLADARLAPARPEFSTDGRRLFLALAERESDVWTAPLERR